MPDKLGTENETGRSAARTFLLPVLVVSGYHSYFKVLDLLACLPSYFKVDSTACRYYKKVPVPRSTAERFGTTGATVHTTVEHLDKVKAQSGAIKLYKVQTQNAYSNVATITPMPR